MRGYVITLLLGGPAVVYAQLVLQCVSRGLVHALFWWLVQLQHFMRKVTTDGEPCLSLASQRD